MMSEKRRKAHVVLTLQQRTEIFKLVDQKVSKRCWPVIFNLRRKHLNLPFMDTKKVIAEKFGLSPSAVGMMLMKRKTFEAGLSQGMNPKRKMIGTSPKTAELNKKVVEIGFCSFTERFFRDDLF